MKRVVKTKTVTRTAEDTIKSTTLDVDTTDTENTSDSKLGILTPTLEYASNDTLSKGLATNKLNKNKNAINS
jgi:hypothetical protein